MKSMDTCSHGCAGIGKGCNNPPGTCWLALMCWHESQDLTYWRTSLFNRGSRTIGVCWRECVRCLDVLQLACHGGHAGSACAILLEGCTNALGRNIGCLLDPRSSEP